jgi:hypothetical protein
MTAIDWTPLRAELAIWRAEQRTLPIWWRDDDAVAATVELDRLALMAQVHEIPIHIAVIPAQAERSLLPYLETGTFRALVHGWAHENHAPEGHKSSEFGTPRAGAAEDAASGLTRLQSLFGRAAHPMFVPPWNRIDADLCCALPGLGYRWMSTYLPRPARFAAPGLEQINTHIDPVDWRGTRGLAEPDIILAKLVANLQDRRTGQSDATEPLGLLTHHLMQDDATWAFCDALMQEMQSVPLEHFDIATAGDTA